jgi:hypothetical protein
MEKKSIKKGQKKKIQVNPGWPVKPTTQIIRLSPKDAVNIARTTPVIQVD